MAADIVKFYITVASKLSQLEVRNGNLIFADIVKFYTTVASKLSQLEVRNGNLIFTSDTKQIYLDIHGNRLGYNCIQVFATDTERSALLAPIEGFYFVEETGVMWRYKEKWVQISDIIVFKSLLLIQNGLLC